MTLKVTTPLASIVVGVTWSELISNLVYERPTKVSVRNRSSPSCMIKSTESEGEERSMRLEGVLLAVVLTVMLIIGIGGSADLTDRERPAGNELARWHSITKEQISESAASFFARTPGHQESSNLTQYGILSGRVSCAYISQRKA